MSAPASFPRSIPRLPGPGRLLPVALLLLGAALPSCSDDAPSLHHPVPVVDTGLQPDLGPPVEDLGPPDLGPEEPDLAPPADEGQPLPDLGPPDLGPPDQGFPPEDLGPPVVDADLPPLPSRVETLLPVEQVAAGTAVRVSCQVLDEQGGLVEGVRTLFLIHPADGCVVEEGGDTFVPQLAGEYLVGCQAPAAGLTDDSPARLEVLPGPVHTSVAVVDRDETVAGETVLVTCTAHDVFGNPLLPEIPGLSVTPSGDGLEQGEPLAHEADASLTVPLTLLRTGFFRLTCPVEGAQVLLPASVRVGPGLPARLAASVSPARPVYGTGEVVTLLAEVTDAHNNPVPGAVVLRSSEPAVPPFGFGRFRFDQDGHFELVATVSGPTLENVLLTARVPVEVSSSGPAISCTSPVDGGVVRQAPGQPVQLVGRVADPNGVRRILVEGQEVPFDRGGSFTRQVTSRFGINFVEILAEDLQGMQSSSFCSFLVADSFHARQDFLGDAVSFRLGQGAIDDDVPDAPLTSLADLLRRMLNSAGLINTVDSMMQAQNPLFSDCVQEWPIFGGCMVHVTVQYRGGTFRLPPPNTISLRLVDGGLRAEAQFGSRDGGDPEIGLNVSVLGDMTVGVDYISVGMTFNAGLSPNGRPAVSLRPGSETVDVGSLHYNGAWWNDWLIDIILPLVDGYFRSQIADLLKSYLRDNIDSILDGVLQNLDIDALGQQFAVPSLTGGAPVNIGVGVNFTRAEFTPERALFGFGMQLQGPVLRAGDPAGAPIPPGAVLYDPGARRTLGAAVSYGVLNKALFTLWQAGFLHFDAATIIPGLEEAPEGTELSLAVSLPPVASAGARSGELRLGLGGARMMLRYPTLFEQAIEIYLAAEGSAGATLIGEREIEFRQVRIDRLLFRTPNVQLDPATRSLIQDLLTEIVQAILDDTVNGALPVLPIPDFELPASLAQYGVPAGTRMGLRSPELETTTGHFVVRGNMGEWR